ncbi:2-keto-4-pentenoate hydratase [Variovorax sp. dw_308]|uniref:2-keto-4-pentenoate hydratase n=1 Tax=Variovorax sp. dw_308 TaxID=2721546 RepID=UPI001C483B66|nr:fumarylacetoacetate hydrolase family protein [Variovorax sp. dw_308]
MTPNQMSEAANAFWSAWQLGAAIDHLLPADRPTTRAEGYAIQAMLEGRSDKPIAGWKIAATSAAGQQHINVSGPLAGRLMAERVHPDGSAFSMKGNRMAVTEAEFVFRMARDMPPRAKAYSVEEALAAVGDLCLGIEVPNSRFADFVTAGEAQIVADNACAHEFVLGPTVPVTWRDLDLAAHRVHATVTGTARSYQRDGVGANVLGDPRIALAWLANELSQLGITLRAGQIVTTGTCVVPLEIVAGDSVQVDFGVLGTVSARFTA